MLSTGGPFATAPLLTTDRLVLAAHRRDDFADTAAMWADPVVTRHIGGRPFTPEEVWAKVLCYAGHWTLMGFGYWAVRDRASDRFVGEVGFADFKREIEPAFGGAPEIGWALAPWAHGRGLASEAVAAALAWGEDHLAASRFVCLIDPANRASLRVAEKVGFRPLAATIYKGNRTTIFERREPG